VCPWGGEAQGVGDELVGAGLSGCVVVTEGDGDGDLLGAGLGAFVVLIGLGDCELPCEGWGAV
jgi:hypothetical protein